jgi:heme/copper-type cytochrome/quinol oxidase subunit 2
MSILNFLAANWDSVLVVVVVIAVVVFLIVKMLFALVTWAEREYGGGTGSLKLAAVIEKIYPHIPAVIRLFLPADALVRLIEKALEQAKLRWEQNPVLLAK